MFTEQKQQPQSTDRESWEELKRQLGEENFKVFVGKEAEELAERKENPIQLPPKPTGILDWTEEELAGYRPKLHKLEGIKALQFKVFNIWNLWGGYRNNQKLIDLLNVVPEDKTSDEFILKCSLVVLIDRLGKILDGETDLIQELTHQ
jgi:hypothetical protein